MTVVQARPRGPRGGATAARPRWLAPAVTVVVFLLTASLLGSVGGKLSDLQRNDSAVFLPPGAEATRVLEESKRFAGMEATPAILVYTRTSGITDADRRDIVLSAIAIDDYLSPRMAGPPMGPLVSDDGVAAEVVILLIGSDPKKLRTDVDWLRGRGADTPELEMHVGGPAAAIADLTEVFGAVDVVLLLVAGAAVLLILVLVYRSPILPLITLGVAGTALGLANGAVFLLAQANVITISGDAQGILDVLVIGAGTDYALLLTSRFREELRRRDDPYEAMRLAWRASAEPIVASGATVIAATLCLLASGLPSTRGLGPVAAIGIGCAVVTMLGLLPMALVLTGRMAFWPFRPAYHSARTPAATGHDAAPRAAERPAWSVSRLAGRRPRTVWVVTVLGLAALSLGLTRLEAHGVPRNRSFLAHVDSTAGQEVLDRHFPDAAGTPAVIVANADRLDDVVAVVSRTPGVVKVVPYVDQLEQYDRRQAGLPDPPPKVVDGLIRVDATLDVPADSPRSLWVIRELRRDVHAIAGADARVGGYTASILDIQATAQRDRMVVIPLILGVVLLILVAVLRAVVAPLFLIATVILSFLAALGVCGVVFRDLWGFAGSDASFPLYAFVFLVALGIDYNIFLMTRVREEVAQRGHRAGVLAGTAATSGVIVSAGMVLAATFAALGVLPLVFLAELAFAVAFGVLLDTLVVRSLLVPALTLDVGRASWWPGRLSRAISTG